MNHGLCINCWWYQIVIGRNYVVTKTGLKEKLGSGRCYMHNGNEENYTLVDGDCYCPDYYNRKCGNREQKMTLEQWISTRKEE